jgi:hypothetical protein
MADRKKKLDAKAKAKRQKVIAGALGVVLLGVLAIQLPRMMKMSHHGSSSSAATTTGTTAAPASPAPTRAAAPAAASPAAGSSLASLAHVGIKFAAGDGQLTSFNRFAAKDPFAQQITTGSSGPTTGGSTTAGSPPPAPVTVPAPAPGLVTGPSTTGTSGGSTTSTSAPTQAVISVNGQAETVAGPSYNFPAADPIFHAKIERTDVKVTIVGGSFASGAPAITLKPHKPITLVNTATGIRYRLELLSLSSSSSN